MSRIKYLAVFAVVLVGVVVGAYIYSYAPSSNQQIPNLPLEGTIWSWVKTTYPLGPDKVPTGDVFILRFYDGKKIGVIADCNGGGGEYTASNGKIRIDRNKLITTEVMCRTQENGYTSMLSDAVGYTHVDPEQLILHLKSSGAKMFFKQNSKP